MAVGRDSKSTFIAVVRGDASQAVTEFRKLGDSVEKNTRRANDATSKWRQLTTSAMAEVRQHANLLAGAALAGIVAFAAKGAQQFVALAKSAIDLGKATGLSTEEASRWIAVADDMEVSAEALTSTVGRIAKTLDATKWSKYGIATRNAGGDARSTNAILVDTLAYLSGLPNATERARIGAELFGKSFSSIAPLLGQTKEEYERMLASVNSGEVITDAEAQKAERMRQTWDDMADSVRSFAMALGSAIGPLTSLLKPLTDLADKFTGVFSPDTTDDTRRFFAVFNEAEGDVVAISNAIDELLRKKWNDRPIDVMDLRGTSNRWKTLKSTFTEVAEQSTDAAQAMFSNFELVVAGAERGSPALQDLADKWGLNRDRLAELDGVLFGVTGGLDAAALAASDLADEQWDVYNATIANINANLGLEGAQQNYLASLDRLNSTTDDAGTLVNEHTVALNAAQGAALAVAAAAADQGKALADAEGATWTAEDATRAQIQALDDMAKWLQPGSPLRVAIEDYANALRTTIPRFVTTTVSVRGTNGAVAEVPYYLANPKNVVSRASGGPAGGLTWAGERGPELVNLPAGSWVNNAGQSRAMMRRALGAGSGGGGMSQVVNIPVTVQATPGTDRARLGREMIDYINAAYAAGAPKLAAA